MVWGKGTAEILEIGGDLLAEGFSVEPGIGLQLSELGLNICPEHLLTAFVALGQRCYLVGDGIELLALGRDEFTDPIADCLPQLLQGQLDLLPQMAGICRRPGVGFAEMNREGFQLSLLTSREIGQGCSQLTASPSNNPVTSSRRDLDDSRVSSRPRPNSSRKAAFCLLDTHETLFQNR
jgi:hypothetical protein